MARIEVHSSPWLRIIEVIVGVGMLLLAGIVIADPGFGVTALVYLIALALLIWAFSTIIVGGLGRLFAPGLRGLSVGSGIVALVISIVILLFPQVAIGLLILLLAFVLLVAGAAELVIAVLAIHRPSWLRAIVGTIGLLTVILSVLVIADPSLGESTLAFILGVIIAIVGVRDIVHGITGHRHIRIQGPSPASL